MTENKQTVALSICGNEDTDKYTIMRHLMFDLGGVRERDVKAAQERAVRTGNGSFPFSAFMDQEKEDRERQIMFRCFCVEFFTDTKHYVMNFDLHVKNYIMGNFNTDVVLLLVSSDDFTESPSNENQDQPKLISMLCRILGIKQIIIGVNNMDSDTVQYKEVIYNEIKEKTITMLIKTGWSKEFIDAFVPIIPISGYVGDNLVNKSENMPWWNGVEIMNPNKENIKIVTLKDAFEKMVLIPEHSTSDAMRTQISGVFKIRNKDRKIISDVHVIKSKDKKEIDNVVTGYVIQGKLAIGDEVIFVPSHTTANPCSGKISSIVQSNKHLDVAIAKNHYGFNVEGLVKDNMPKACDIMILKNEDSPLIRRVVSFTCQIKVFEDSRKLKVGECPFILARVGRSFSNLTAINWKISKGIEQYNPTSLNTNDFAECVFEPEKPLIVDSFNNCEQLGLLAMFDGQRLIMAGRIVSVNYEDPLKEEKQF